MGSRLMTIPSRPVKIPWLKIESTPDKLFTAGRIIDAYQAGRQDGMNYINDELKKKLKTNLMEVLPKIEAFYNSIPVESKGFMTLQISSINYFQVIIALDKSVYFDDDRCKPIYKSSSVLCRKLKNVNISFMPYKGENSINFEGLVADDYLFIYGAKQKKH